MCSTVHVIWFTGRSMADLCATTQRALVAGLLERNVSITFLNGDENMDVYHQNFMHVALPQTAPRGLQSRALGKDMRKWLVDNPPHRAVAVVEWRIAGWVVPELVKQGIPWTLMDRSPPADAGLFGRLQWLGWKAAWKAAARQAAPGFVVSKAHRVFVEKKTGHRNVSILQAGVDFELFKPQPKRSTLTMVYHGQLDRHRGVLACAMLAQKARSEGVEVDVVFVGKGNLSPSLEALAEANPFIHFHTTMNQRDLAVLVGSCHIGLLPMPNQTVWALASPLKRSEYLACGLSVFGINHEGHRLEKVDSDWFTLVAQEDFHLNGLDFLRKHVHESHQLNQSPRAFAIEELGWSSTVDQFAKVLAACHQMDS